MPPRDRAGGYPGRLTRRLVDRASVIGRGFPGATTLSWLDDHPSTARGGEPGPTYPDLFRRLQWRDLPPQAGELGAPNLLLATLRLDRPDLVILLIGVNDLHYRLGSGAGSRSPASIPDDIVDETVERIGRLRSQAESAAEHVLVSTLLPNQRDSPELLQQLNARIRSQHPDFLPLGEEFAAAGWRDLLSDVIHPNEAGYELLAELVEEQLVARGLVRPADPVGGGSDASRSPPASERLHGSRPSAPTSSPRSASSAEMHPARRADRRGE
jgi:lysophospholipase L1-like esterase